MGEEEDHHTREASQKINCNFFLAFDFCRARLDPMQQDKIESAIQPTFQNLTSKSWKVFSSMPVQFEQSIESSVYHGKLWHPTSGRGRHGFGRLIQAMWILQDGIEPMRMPVMSPKEIGSGKRSGDGGALPIIFWLCNAWNLLRRGLHRYSEWQSVPEKLQGQMAPSSMTAALAVF